MVDVMIDLETLDNKSSAAVVSIGACTFDRMTGKIIDTFYRRIDMEAAIASGGTCSGSTLIWWLQQDDDARIELTKGGSKISVAMEDFIKFLPANCVVWGNGSSFDISILDVTFERLKLTAPWKFWDVRDVRTVLDIASHLVKKSDVPFVGTKHNALSDAIHQATYVAKMWAAVKKAK